MAFIIFPAIPEEKHKKQHLIKKKKIQLESIYATILTIFEQKTVFV